MDENGNCPIHGKKPDKVSEENYFFKLTKYKDAIIKHIKENPDFIKNYNLTEREVEVLKYICDGLNNGEISKILDVSVNTIKVHVSSIIQKLEVEDRTQVVVKAFKNLFV